MSRFTVSKFGGTSVADFTAMSRCAAIISDNRQNKLVIMSACSGVTNLLVQLANGVPDLDQREKIINQIAAIHQAIIEKLKHPELITKSIHLLLNSIHQASEQAAKQPTKQLTDHLVSHGELMSTHLLTQVLMDRGIDARRFDIREILRTNSDFGKAEPDLNVIHHAAPMLSALCQQRVIVTQGFIGSDAHGHTTTLGRGGSDYSAALIAEAVDASELEIWTDVPGIYTTDPRIAPKAHPIAEISFSEASEMANFGAKILHPSTLLPALRRHIPVYVGSSKQPEKGGTWIKESMTEAPLFRALALRNNQTMVTLRSLDMFQAYGFLAKAFAILAKHKVSIDLITTSEVSVALTLDQTDTSGGAPQLPLQAISELEQLCHVEVEHNLSLVALIGNQMSSSTGYARQVFDAIDDINIRVICCGASPHNLCFLINEHDGERAIRQLHHALFE